MRQDATNKSLQLEGKNVILYIYDDAGHKTWVLKVNESYNRISNHKPFFSTKSHTIFFIKRKNKTNTTLASVASLMAANCLTCQKKRNKRKH